MKKISMKKMYKLRWINGWGNEFDQTQYQFYLENRKTKELTPIDYDWMQNWLKENKLTTNDFRNIKEEYSITMLVNDLINEEELIKC